VRVKRKQPGGKSNSAGDWSLAGARRIRVITVRRARAAVLHVSLVEPGGFGNFGCSGGGYLTVGISAPGGGVGDCFALVAGDPNVRAGDWASGALTEN